MFRSIRWSLQVWHAAILAMVLVVFGWVVYHLLKLTTYQQIDAELNRTAELVPGARFAVPTSALQATGGAMVTAAQPSQLSEPYAAADHGLFSYFFAGSVRGWADGELDGKPDGTVTLREASADFSASAAGNAFGAPLIRPAERQASSKTRTRP